MIDLPIVAWVVLGLCGILAGFSALYMWSFRTMSAFRPNNRWK